MSHPVFDQAPPPSDEVQPQPVPTTWLVQAANLTSEIGVRTFVKVEIKTPTGSTVLYLDPNETSAIAALLEQTAGRARTGLILPPSPSNG